MCPLCAATLCMPRCLQVLQGLGVGAVLVKLGADGSLLLPGARSPIPSTHLTTHGSTSSPYAPRGYADSD